MKQKDSKLIIGISSRALFNLDESHEIYENEGLDSYRKYQIDNEDNVLDPGEAFTLVEKILKLNDFYNKPRIAVDGNVRRVFSRNLNIEENKINFDKFIEKNKKNFFITKRNDDFVEALMEFGALICKPKDPNCLTCCLNKTCKSVSYTHLTLPTIVSV